MQMLCRLLLTIGVLTLAIAGVGTSSAGEKKKKKERERHATVITAIDPTAISIKEDKADKTVPITPSTEIYVRGQKADLAALQPGMAVNITLAMDGIKASRINASDLPVQRASEQRKAKTRKQSGRSSAAAAAHS